MDIDGASVPNSSGTRHRRLQRRCTSLVPRRVSLADVRDDVDDDEDNVGAGAREPAVVGVSVEDLSLNTNTMSMSSVVGGTVGALLSAYRDKHPHHGAETGNVSNSNVAEGTAGTVNVGCSGHIHNTVDSNNLPTYSDKQQTHFSLQNQKQPSEGCIPSVADGVSKENRLSRLYNLLNTPLHQHNRRHSGSSSAVGGRTPISVSAGVMAPLSEVTGTPIAAPIPLGSSGLYGSSLRTPLTSSVASTAQLSNRNSLSTQRSALDLADVYGRRLGPLHVDASLTGVSYPNQLVRGVSDSRLTETSSGTGTGRTDNHLHHVPSFSSSSSLLHRSSHSYTHLPGSTAPAAASNFAVSLSGSASAHHSNLGAGNTPRPAPHRAAPLTTYSFNASSDGCVAAPVTAVCGSDGAVTTCAYTMSSVSVVDSLPSTVNTSSCSRLAPSSQCSFDYASVGNIDIARSSLHQSSSGVSERKMTLLGQTRQDTPRPLIHANTGRANGGFGESGNTVGVGVVGERVVVSGVGVTEESGVCRERVGADEVAGRIDNDQCTPHTSDQLATAACVYPTPPTDTLSLGVPAAGVLPTVPPSPRESTGVDASRTDTVVVVRCDAATQTDSVDCGSALPAPAMPPPPPPLPPSSSNSSSIAALCSSRQLNKVTLNGREMAILSQIGRGGSSDVYRVLDASMRCLALKIVNLQDCDPATMDGFINEIKLLRKLQHSNRVVQLVDWEHKVSLKRLHIMMELGDTDLSTLMRSYAKVNEVSVSMCKFFWEEMLRCVDVIHREGIIHSDLKPSNFLMVSGRLKLIDFGIASQIQADCTSVVKDYQLGTFNYISPEAIQSQQVVANGTSSSVFKISRRSDVWSLGCILYNFVYGHTPFNDIKKVIPKMMAIINPDHAIPFPSLSNSHLMNDLRCCLNRNPYQRPTIEQLLNSSYLNS